MDFHKLEMFVCVCDCKNITKAAEKLYLTQPALSRTISQMEANLGVPLFERSGNSIELNENGKKLYRFAKKVLKKYSELLNDFSAAQENLSIRICYADAYFADFIILEMMKNTSWNISLGRINEENIAECIAKGEYDLGFSKNPHALNGVKCTHLFSSEVFVSIPVSNPLSVRKSVSLSDLNGESILYLDSESTYLEHFKKLLKKKAPDHKIESIARRDVYELLKETTDSLYFLNTYERLFLPDSKQERKILRVNDVGSLREVYMVYSDKSEKTASTVSSWISETMKQRWYRATHVKSVK